jgi:hypothetical protein
LRRLSQVQAVLAVAIAAVLVGDAVAYGHLPRHATLHAPGELAAEIGPLQAFVETQRGLEFRKGVAIRLVDQTALSAPDEPAAADDAASKQERAQALVLVALGLAESADAVKRANDLVAGAILGRYLPERHELLVRKGPIDDFTRSILVHELTHALDDQRLGLTRGNRFSIDESDLSFHALAEGNATYVEDEYVKTHPQAAARRQQDSEQPLPAGIPEALLAIASYPYLAGVRFIGALRASGGVEAVNRAFRDPPVTSEQVLHPDRYLRGEPPRVAIRPKPEGEVVDRGVLGELVLRLMLETRDNPVADAAATGWGGDRYVAWRSGNQICLRAHIIMDSPTDVTELRTALTAWAAAHPGARLSGTATMLVLDRCVA